MADHYNLYYLFQEDQARHPMPEHHKKRVQKNLEKFFKNIKPDPISNPPNIRTHKETDSQN